jgi:hypothetical protein
MTPAQEKKIDDLHALVLSMKGDLRVVDERIGQHREAILDHEKEFVTQRKAIASLDADRNKVKGAMWVSASTAFLAFLAFIGSFLKR